MLTLEYAEALIKEMTAAEEKRLGVNSPEFMARHNEIMAMADEMQKRYKRNAPAGTGNIGRAGHSTAGAAHKQVYDTMAFRGKEDKNMGKKERIIKMLLDIETEAHLNMIYGFVRRFYQESKRGERSGKRVPSGKDCREQAIELLLSTNDAHFINQVRTILKLHGERKGGAA